jgi:putative SOS response-associated peptidase YedK
MENRVLMPGEEPENVVLEFKPKDHVSMVVPCVWDRWICNDEVLNSFALITDEPPPEIAAAGHDRCPINLTQSAAEAWLVPQRQSASSLLQVLEDRQRPYYEHFRAAA